MCGIWLVICSCAFSSTKGGWYSGRNPLGLLGTSSESVVFGSSFHEEYVKLCQEIAEVQLCQGVTEVPGLLFTRE